MTQQLPRVLAGDCEWTGFPFAGPSRGAFKVKRGEKIAISCNFLGQVVKIPAKELALDDEIPGAWPQIDALKLSVNGAERNTMATTSS